MCFSCSIAVLLRCHPLSEIALGFSAAMIRTCHPLLSAYPLPHPLASASWRISGASKDSRRLRIERVHQEVSQHLQLDQSVLALLSAGQCRPRAGGLVLQHAAASSTSVAVPRPTASLAAMSAGALASRQAGPVASASHTRTSSPANLPAVSLAAGAPLDVDVPDNWEDDV